MSLRSSHLYGTFLTVLGVLILTPDGLLVRLVDLDSWTLMFWRGTFFAASILGFYFIRSPQSFPGRVRIMGWRGIQAAVFFAGSTIFFVLAIQNTTIANTLVIIATAPLCSALISRLFLKEQVSLSTWIAIIVSTGGIAILFLGEIEGGSRIGDFYAFGSALCIASQITTVRLARNVDMVPSLGISGIMIALIALPFSTPMAVTPEQFSLLFLMAFVILPLSFGLITIGPRYIPAAEVSLIMLLETFLGPVWAWFVVDEKPEMETVIGGALIITTLLVHSVHSYRGKRITSIDQIG
ncbi:MAG: DMT family transporter [Sneathiellales bacterium]|nr:DMT family transporter [Sneathiellales bacterium]